MKIPRHKPAARVLTAVVWRQCSPKRELLDTADPAVTAGRYHRVGARGVWYASSSESASWAELFRHQEADAVSAPEAIRRMGQARVRKLRVLDLTDARVCEMLDINASELVGDDLRQCQEVAQYASDAGYDAILAPSAALAGETTLAVFASAMGKISAQRSHVGPPPVRVRRLLGRVRISLSRRR